MIQALRPVVGPDDLYEVIGGERRVKPVGARENRLANRLAWALEAFAFPRQLGEASVEMMFDLPGVENDRRPDVAFVSYARWPRDREIPVGASWAVVPELAVEVVSPTNTFDEVMGKVEEYFRAGVSAVWVVHPATKSVHVYTGPTQVRIVARAEELAGEPAVPGFRLALADLFPPAEA